MYNVTLEIGGLTLEDTTKTYEMRANNQFGRRDYRVRLSSSSAIVDGKQFVILFIWR